MALGPLGTLALFAGGIVLLIFLLIFVAVPVFRGIGSLVNAGINGIGWLFTHLFEFVVGMIRDSLRFIGALLAFLVFAPLVPINVIIGRWSAANHFAHAVKRECSVGGTCLYRVVLRHPLKLLLLHPVLEGFEQRVPPAIAAAPGADTPSARIGQFPGYEIVGSLRAGGSGAKLYIAAPSADKRRKNPAMPERVVIKCFALAEGSGLPQIVRESRALECAKQLGHVLDHGMDDHRFFYVMPYHAGDHLGIVARQLHGQSGGTGLSGNRLAQALSYATDLLATLAAYHRGGLWHKDVKPENIIIHDSRAHLVDLGLMTSLRSPMTLTTHGTEYFRDPEMVRMALKGVKVHQVNGAKFDIYAAGAVLYFLLENTFPPHGGLSRFTLHSPEALRWVVRRSMTDYNQRYASADEMLADLAFIARASNPYDVKPAELPSMRTGSAGAAQFIPPVETVAAASVAAAATPAPQAVGVMYGIHGGAGGFRIGRIPLDAAGNPLPAAAAAAASRRPRLSIANWWTGRYRVDDAGGPGSNPSPSSPAPAPRHGVTAQTAQEFRRHARDYQNDVRHIAAAASLGMAPARRAAREQIRAARHRAMEMRARIRARRPGVAVQRQPSATVTGIVIATVILAGAGVLGVRALRKSNLPGAVFSSAASPAVLLVIDPAVESAPAAAGYVQETWRAQEEQGYRVMMSAGAQSAEMAHLIQIWRGDDRAQIDSRVEDLMEQCDVYGVLYISPTGRRDVQGRQQLQRLFIYSTRRNADARLGKDLFHVEDVIGAAAAQHTADQFPAPPVPAQVSGKLLVLNDHPAGVDPEVQKNVSQILAAYTAAGWQIQSDDDVEVAIRRLLPLAAKPDPGTREYRNAQAVLSEHGYVGVLWISAAPGDGPPSARTQAQTLIFDLQSEPNPAADPPLPDTPAQFDFSPPPSAVSPNR